MSADVRRARRHQFPQIWLLLTGLVALAFYVALDKSYLQTMFEADQSYLSSIILIVFACASGHAAWFTFKTSSQIEVAERTVRNGSSHGDRREAVANRNSLHVSAGDFVAGYMRDLVGGTPNDDAADGAEKETSYILEVYADRLRSPVDLGWYIVDILIRLGLIGTIIGFILILGALADGPIPTGDNIQALLITMSGGMGTALYTTLAGLVTATLLGAQYMVLSRGVERLIDLLIQIRNRAAHMDDV